MSAKGVDVSSNNPTGYSLTGSDFVFVKATEGRSYVSSVQEEQAARARDHGLVVGFYHFLWPGAIAAQAKHFVEKCASREGDLLACDWETTTARTHATGAEKDAFLKEVKRLRPAHKVVLYCNRDFWFHHDTTSEAQDGLWIADPSHPAGHPGVQHPWTFHQYAVSGGLDRNVAAFDSREDLRVWAGGTAAPKPPAPKPTQPTVDLSRLVAAAKSDPPKHGTPVSYYGTKTVEQALVAEQLLDRGLADGHFGTATVKAYAAWQRRCGYSGKAADGIPGKDSLTRLGSKHGFKVVA